MGYKLNKEGMNQILQQLSADYLIYAPKCYLGGGKFSDTDCIRYGEIKTVEEIEFNKKSEYSFKEVLTPISQTLFFLHGGHGKRGIRRRRELLFFLEAVTCMR